MLETVSTGWIDLITTHSAGLAVMVGLALIVDRVFNLGTRARYGLWLTCLAKAVIPPFYELGESSVLVRSANTGVVVIEQVASAGTVGAAADQVGSGWMFAGWAAVSTVLAAILIVRNYGLLRRVRRASPVCVASTTGIDLPTVEMDVNGPFLVGLLRPTLVLPVDWRTWDPAFLDAVLVHEHEHYRSRDLWVLLVEQIAVCLLWFHPGVWLVRRKLHLIREHRSDEAVVSRGLISRTRYAERLVDMIEGVRRRPMPSVGLTSGTIGKRIFHLLSREEFAVDITRHQYALLIGFALLLVPLSARGVTTPSGSSAGDSIASGDRSGDLEFFQIAPEDRPVLVKHVPPVYPDAAREDLLQGRVFVRFRVGVDGRVDSAVVIKGGEVFRDAALTAIRQFEFRPAAVDGEPISVWMTQAIKFSTPSVVRPRYLMELYLKPDGQTFLENRGPVSVDEVVSTLRERRMKRRSATVTILAGQDLSDETLQVLVERIRSERVDVVVTLK